MKTFKTYISELKIEMPPKGAGLGIPRSEMPQVAEKDYPDYFKYLKNKNITFKEYLMNPNDLKPIQKDFNVPGVERSLDKIAKILASGSKDKFILVSKDNYIVDGHHRWIAYKNLKKDIAVLKANVPMKKLLKVTLEYPKIYRSKYS